MSNIHEEGLEKAIYLLQESLWFINNVPNNEYSTRSFEDSYALSSEIWKYLRQLNADPYAKKS